MSTETIIKVGGITGGEDYIGGEDFIEQDEGYITQEKSIITRDINPGL